MRTLNCVRGGPVRRWWRAGPFFVPVLCTGSGVSGAGYYVTVTIYSAGGALFSGEWLAGCQPNNQNYDEGHTIRGNINRAKSDTFNERPLWGGAYLKN